MTPDTSDALDDIDVVEGQNPPVPADDIAVDPDSQVLSVETDPDGNVVVEFGPIDQPEPDDIDADHGDNLAETIGEDELGRIATDLLEAIQQDDASRQEWLNMRADGVKLLGLTIEKPQEGSVDGISTIRHPLLLEAVLRFQANARSELLPTDGPVKIRDDGSNDMPPGLLPPGTPNSDDRAEALERDANHYLTVTAPEYVPDTDRMLWWVGFGGMAFKKLYHHPIKRRPVSESVDAADIIVSNDAIDIQSAGRVTHRIKMRPATLKRMQIAKAYRKVDVVDVERREQNALEQAVDESQGRTDTFTMREEDRERLIYECYCELDLLGYEHEEDGEVTGLPLPYKVTIDEQSQTILEIRRNWAQGDEMYLARQVFVPFVFVPGMGFYGIGLLNILGNTTNAITGAYRMLLDAGMLSNFPGGLIAKGAMKQDRLSFRAGVGEFIPIDTGGAPILQSVMPFPYKGPDPALMQLADGIAQTGQRIGGTAEMNVGEGRADAPVGTTVALIEQATKVLDAVHKRLHAAQAREFQLMVDLWREDPASFYRGNKRPAAPWDEAMLRAALDDYDLIPVADPNTSSHMQRLMRMQAVTQMATQAPQLFDVSKVVERSLRMLQIPNYQELLAPPGSGGPQQPQQDPSKMLMAQARMADVQLKAKQLEADQQSTVIDAQTRQAEIQQKTADNIRSLQDQAADRASQEKIAHLKAISALVTHDSQKQHDAQQAHIDRGHDLVKFGLNGLARPAPVGVPGGEV